MLVNQSDADPGADNGISYGITAKGYRYGFNGQERSDEVMGEGNHNTAEFWEYDTRTGRRWNLDPKVNVSISPYNTFRANPILFSDFKGDTVIGEPVNMAVYKDYRKDINSRVISTVLDMALKQSQLDISQDKKFIKKTTAALAGANNKLSELRTINNELNALESSTQNYVITSTNDPNSNKGGETGFASAKAVNGRIYSAAILVSFNRAHTPLASLSHELKHAFQFESLNWIEDFSHSPQYQSYTHSLANEIEAYKRELFYWGSLLDTDASGNVITVKDASKIDGNFVLRRGYGNISTTSEQSVVMPAALRAQAKLHNISTINAQKSFGGTWMGAGDLIIYKGWDKDAAVR